MDWAKGITYTIIDNYAILRNIGISEGDIKEYGDEMMQQIIYEFNHVPWGVDNLVFSWDIKNASIIK